MEFGKQIEFACGPKASKFQTNSQGTNLSLTRVDTYINHKNFHLWYFIIIFLLLLSQHYSSQQSGCILFLFLVSRRKGIYSQAPFLLKLSCKHHRLVDDQLIDPSTMRASKDIEGRTHLWSPLNGLKVNKIFDFYFYFGKKRIFDFYNCTTC